MSAEFSEVPFDVQVLSTHSRVITVQANPGRQLSTGLVPITNVEARFVAAALLAAADASEVV